MLVKIVTEYGVCPTVVAWDAGSSGRTELFAEYKAQRRSRPDLLKQQWPAMEPLVEAFGYRNVRLEGYEADDVIASLAEQALQSSPPVPVMIVTGDRDVFQLIDERGPGQGDGDLARDHRDEDLRPPGGDRPLRDPARADPGLLRPEGRHLRQHPRDPRDRRQDRQRADPELRLARGRAVARRGHQRAQAQTEPARPRRGRARVKAPGHGPARPAASSSTSPPRPRASPTARACARSSARTSCATRCGAWRRRWATPSSPRRRLPPRCTLSARVRAGAPADIAGLGAERRGAVRGRRAPRGARGRAVRRGRALALRRRRRAGRTAEARRSDRRRCWRGLRGPEQVVAAAGSARSSPTTPRRSALVPPGLAHDTLLGAYLLEPARRGYPFAELCEERGLASDVEDPLAGDAVLLGALADVAARADRRARPAGGDGRHRAAAGGGAARDGAARRAPEPRAPGGDHRPRARGDRRAGSGDLRARRARSS